MKKYVLDLTVKSVERLHERFAVPFPSISLTTR